jgi:hypothetical protein
MGACAAAHKERASRYRPAIACESADDDSHV